MRFPRLLAVFAFLLPACFDDEAGAKPARDAMIRGEARLDAAVGDSARPTARLDAAAPADARAGDAGVCASHPCASNQVCRERERYASGYPYPIVPVCLERVNDCAACAEDETCWAEGDTLLCEPQGYGGQDFRCTPACGANQVCELLEDLCDAGRCPHRQRCANLTLDCAECPDRCWWVDTVDGPGSYTYCDPRY